MKIISPFKDYYDYLMGIYGVDEKVVYERVCQSNSRSNWTKTGLYKVDSHLDCYGKYEPTIYYLAICGRIYISIEHQGKFYFGIEGYKQLKGYKCVSEALDEESYLGYEKGDYWYNKFDNNGIIDQAPTDINEKDNCPVILLNRYKRREFSSQFKNVRLSDFGINQIISPHDMYIMISNFLSREKPIEDKRTNVEKIVGHGFDKKTSFRHPIK